jgi:hypothetical protein
VPRRPIASRALLTAGSISLLSVYSSLARSEQPGLEADSCYPTRDAAIAAFGNGRTVMVEGQITRERSGEVEIFEILSRSGDDAAVLLNSLGEGGACILIEGHAPTSSASVTHTKFGSPDKHAAPPRSDAR